MADGINISIGSDTRGFASGVQKGLISPLEDARDVLEDIAKTGQKSTSQLEEAFRDQQRATVDYGRDYQRMSDQIQEASRKTSRQVQADSQDTTRHTEEGFDEIRESARSNAIETAASFDGSFEGIAGGLQGLLSEFLAGFGPAGIIAGLAAASGLGLITQAITGGQEAAEAQKQAISDLASEYIEAGKTGTRTFDNVASAIEAMATSTDGSDVAITLQEAFKRAKEAGADYQEVVTSIAQASPQELQQVIDKVQALEKQHIDAGNAAMQDGRLFQSFTDNSATGAAVLLKALQKTKDAADQAADAQRLAAKAGLSEFQLKADAIKQVEDAYDETASNVDDYLDKEKGTLKVGPYLAAIEKKREALKKYKDELAESELSPAAKKFLESQGADAAAAMLSGYQKASPKQKAQLNEVWSTAGTENASSYEDALGKKISTIKAAAPKIERPVVPAPDTSAIDAYLAQPSTKRIVLDVVTRSGERVP